MRDQNKTQSPIEKLNAVSFLKDKAVITDSDQPKTQMKLPISTQKRINPRLLIL